MHSLENKIATCADIALARRLLCDLVDMAVDNCNAVANGAGEHRRQMISDKRAAAARVMQAQALGDEPDEIDAALLSSEIPAQGANIFDVAAAISDRAASAAQFLETTLTAARTGDAAIHSAMTPQEAWSAFLTCSQAIQTARRQFAPPPEPIQL